MVRYIAVNDAHRFFDLADWVAMFDRSKEREGSTRTGRVDSGVDRRWDDWTPEESFVHVLFCPQTHLKASQRRRQNCDDDLKAVEIQTLGLTGTWAQDERIQGQADFGSYG